jgi:hypothetical protein
MHAALLTVILSGTGTPSYSADVSTHVLGAAKKALSASTDTVNAGYYSATALSVVDPDLKADNIQSGVTIFGKVGTLSASEFLDTGQTTPYMVYDDAHYLPAAGQLLYTDNGNGTISDNRTALMWKKCSEPDTTTGCSGSKNTYTWSNALSACESLTYPAAGYTDWRLPNAKELYSILKMESSGALFINATYFPNSMITYWTSTTDVLNTTYAMLVRFDYSYFYSSSKSDSNYVRCVRDGP